MKKIFLFASAALMFAACSNDDLTVADKQAEQVADSSVGFDAYIQRSTTRTGWVGTVTGGAEGLGKSSASVADLGYHGFGVFGYYTDNNEYDPQSLPNFFYNQKVYAKDANNQFVYDPVKYWPNEYGSNSISDDADKVTFFAYAPYVEVVPSTGKIKATGEETKWGITGMSRNIASGDPLIKYLVSFDQDKMVDLCWGVCDDPVWATINDGDKSLNEGVKGKPWINVERPLKTDASQKVKFTFKHALSQLNVTADTYADGDVANSIDAKSRVYVRSITFTGFATKGTLNLNNETPNKAQWLDYNGTAELESGEEVTIYDGRKDGKEGTAGGVATNEKVLGLNPMFVQDENQLADGAFISTSGYHTGVDGTVRNMFRKFNGTDYEAMAAGDPILVIPTGEAVKVTIVYDVETPSPNLGVYLSDGRTPGSTIENRIEKEINFGTEGMENGKKYTIHLHLGMNSVKIDADVTAWQDDMSTDVNLPSNKPEFVAAASASYDYSVPAAGVTDFAVNLTGFNGGAAITTSKDAPGVGSSIIIDIAGKQANESGVVAATFSVSANNTVNNKSGWAKWEGAGKQVQLNITQTAHELGLKATAISSDATVITLTSTAENPWGKVSTDPSNIGITVVKDGVKLAYNSTPGANEFKYDPSTGKITLPTTEPAQAGDVFVITVKAGDAPEETVTARVGGFYYAPATKTITWRKNVGAYTVNDIKPIYTGDTDPAPDWSGVITSSNTSVATIDGSNNLTTVALGTTTLSATVTTSFSGFDVKTAPKLNLTVVKQNSAFNDKFADRSVSNKQMYYTIFGDYTSRPITRFNEVKVIGAEDGDYELSGAIKYEVVSATKDGSALPINNFIWMYNDELRTKVSLEEGEYIIKVKASHAGDAYCNPVDETITVTLTVLPNT